MPVVIMRNREADKKRSPRTSPRSPPRSPAGTRVIMKSKMAATETEPEERQVAMCAEHTGCEIVMFCQDCEVLMCTKCVCQGPNSSRRHTDHVPLDLSEASSIYKGDLENLINRVKSVLERKKQLRLLSQQRLQKIKFDLLRKRTFIERRKRSLLDRIQKDDAQFRQDLESLVAEHVDSENSRFRELDYSVVSQEGLLCTLESLNKLEELDRVSFLKNFVKAKGEVDKVTLESEDDPPDLPTDVSSECAMIRRVNLTLAPEKELIGRALEMPTQAPSKPRLLQSWCVIGSYGASLVWKHDLNVKVDKFHVFFNPACPLKHNFLRRLTSHSHS